MKSIETCRECRRHNGQHTLSCQAFARQFTATEARLRRTNRPKAEKGAAK